MATQLGTIDSIHNLIQLFETPMNYLNNESIQTKQQQRTNQLFAQEINYSQILLTKKESIYNQTQNTKHDLLTSLPLKRLAYMLKLYDNNNVSDINIICAVNDFLYLLEHHNNVSDFELIYKKLVGDCNGSFECKLHNRIHDYTSQTVNEITISQIMNKIHSFYLHSVTHNTKRISNRFVTNNGQYLFGYNFIYDNQRRWFQHQPEWSGVVIISAKYSTLKQEITTNSICRLTMNKFDNEFQKAQIYFNSSYCKQNFDIKLEHILSLMFYCNHDELQYLFSKTCRDNNINQHNNFYHLGRTIKRAISIYGTDFNKGNVNILYHGISKQLMFPSYIGYHDNGITIQCPLSTSSSVTVASNFTNNKNGLIIEFAYKQSIYEISNSFDVSWPFKICKYFSVSWLSDYANESEYLFYQSGAG
eukprot:108423_1